MNLYVMMTTEFTIKYFLEYRLVLLVNLMTKCLLFTEKLFVVLGHDTSTQGSTEGPQRFDTGSTGGRGLTVCCGHGGN